MYFLLFSRWIAQLLWYISDSTVDFPPEYFQYLELDCGVKTLQHLSIVTLRRHIKAPFKKNVNSLFLPNKHKISILMENEMKESIFHKRIRLSEYEKVDLNDFMSGSLKYSKAGEKIFINVIENFQKSV